MSSTRWLIATVVGVIVVAVTAVIVTSVREPTTLPDGTPEATVQRYLQAVADGDRQAVLETYTPALRRRCEEQGPEPRPPLPEERRSFDADLLEVRELDGERVDVEVRISEFSGEPPFDSGGGYDHTEVLRVERGDGEWGIAHASWPYYVCPG